ncbi:MAG TPA: enolase C-terminal domain-like protein [Methylomirabilota bacterium]|nr:enolase C-terminal domain-like protein [Methylomirabilota bacterium]
MPLALALRDASFHVREVRLRLPFRFGVITVTEATLLHLAITAEAAGGRRARGFAGDFLAPKWFDKDPTKSHRRNVEDLIESARDARAAYADAARAPRAFWPIWRDAYAECRRRGAARGFNGLVVSFGSALFERALADAAGRLAGADVVEMLQQDLLGLRPGEIHSGLAGRRALAWADDGPPETVAVRHTVGLADPITAADLPPDGGPRDGLPRTLEEYVARHGLRYFKLKVAGQVEEDLDRIARVAAVLDRSIPDRYVITLDGNEQYKALEPFAELLVLLDREPRLARLASAVVFVEQPLDRVIALDPAATGGLTALARRWPMLIDESDGELDSFRMAIALGYRGVSSKNCKGIVKAFLNRTLVERLNAERAPGERLFMSAEDLTNVPVVPLQQDLATVRALGLTHVERNGHHYVRGLAHCSPAERGAATRRHADLYDGNEREAALRIRDGRLALGSLAVPGYGVAVDPDLDSMTPVEAWLARTRS